MSAVARLTDEIKETWENQTLCHFMSARREAGGPHYAFVRIQERPDRVIRIQGTEGEIGVEVTRVTVGEDAKAHLRDIFRAAALRDLLLTQARGGWLHLSGGSTPDSSPDAIASLIEALRDQISRGGGLRVWVAGLERGEWEHHGTVWSFSKLGERAGWRFASNHVPRPARSVLDAIELDNLILERAADKARKVVSYRWRGPLLVLIRNPYQRHQPSPGARSAIAEMFEGPECWLVNHTEGTLDAAPPEPRVVRLA